MNSAVLEYQIFVRLTIDIPILRCGHLCSHVLKITNELTLDMIKFNIGNLVPHIKMMIIQELVLN